MNKRLQTLKYYFSVEGETEYLYLMWLQDKINETGSCRVKFDAKIEKSPLKRTRGLPIIQTTEIWHFCDYESPDRKHVKQFENTIDEMIKSGKDKEVVYHLGYSNFTFELWMILHKKDCNGPKSHRKQYLEEINEAFEENFKTLRQYKQEKEFTRCLSKLTLDDVRVAVSRARAIMKNKKTADTPVLYKDYPYYSNNPALAVHEIIEQILADCGLNRKRR